MTDSPQDDARLRATEAQMRRALGLQDHEVPRSEPDRSVTPLSRTHTQRRRFVQAGEVPVTLIHRQSEEGVGTNLLGAARRALGEQVAAREAAEHALAEAQGMIRDLQTKLAHERLGRDEQAARVDAERRADQQAIEALRAELAAEQSAREEAEARLRDAQKPRQKTETKSAATASRQLQEAPRKRGRPKKVAGKPARSARPKPAKRAAVATRGKAKQTSTRRGRPPKALKGTKRR